MIVILRAKGKGSQDVVEYKEEEINSSCEGPEVIALEMSVPAYEAIRR
jgi:hypothetical protein